MPAASQSVIVTPPTYDAEHLPSQTNRQFYRTYIYYVHLIIVYGSRDTVE